MSIILHLSAAASEAAPLATGTGPDIPWGRVILAFLFCIALAIAAIGFIRVRNGMPLLPDRLLNTDGGGRGGPEGAGRNRMQITQRLNVSPAHQIVMLKRGSRNYIIHLGAQGATEIDRFTDGDAPDDAEPDGKDRA